MVRKKSRYHILVAQNFLSSISVDGSQNGMQIPSVQGIPNINYVKKESAALDSVKESVLSLGTSTSFNESFNHINDIVDEEQHKVNFMVSSARDTPNKKTSIFRRIAKIMSTDDVIYSMTATSSRAPILEEDSCGKEEVGYIEYRSESPNSSENQFSFLKRLKSTISHVDRWYMCSETSGVPLAVFSYVPTNSDYVDPASSVFSNNTITKSKKHRSKSVFGSSDRMRGHYTHNSIEELRPFSFRDSQDYISLSQLRRKRNPSPFFTLFEKPTVSFFKRDRKESCKPVDFTEEIPLDIIQSHQTRESGSDEKNEESARELETVVDYDPHLFDELAIGKRTIIRQNFYVGSTLHFATPEKAKSAMNEDFAEKYSHIHLTLSKMMSLKREMLALAKMHSVDCHTLAVAYVYFEQIVEMGLISKSNRKCVAGVCLLVAMKMNDFNKSTIKSFLENAEDQLREQKSDLLDYELPLCTALKFRLLPTIDELQLHIDRLQFELY